MKSVDTLSDYDNLMVLLDDTVYINSVNYPLGSAKWGFNGMTLTMDMGDIQPGTSATVQFKVQFKNDAGGGTFTNYANLSTVRGQAPEVKMEVPDKPNTEIAQPFFRGMTKANGYVSANEINALYDLDATHTSGLEWSVPQEPSVSW